MLLKNFNNQELIVRIYQGPEAGVRKNKSIGKI
jgi:hypothetical protein